MVAEAGTGDQGMLAQPGVGRVVRGKDGGISLVPVISPGERRELLAASHKTADTGGDAELPNPRDGAAIESSRRLLEETSLASLKKPVSLGGVDQFHGPYKGYAGRQPTWDERLIKRILKKFPFFNKFMPEKEEK